MPALLLRLYSLLTQLPTGSLPPRLLSVGCGEYPCADTIRSALPGWTLYGVDVDGEALCRARRQDSTLRLVQADAVNLPGLLRAEFGLILARHPDLYLHRSAWRRILTTLPQQLAPGGFLLITLYAPEEVDFVRKLTLPPPYSFDERSLPPPGLAGFDRFALLYRTATI